MARLSQKCEWDDSPPALSWELTVGSLLLAVGSLAVGILTPCGLVDVFVRETYGPLTHGDPVVQVTVSHFATPAMLLLAAVLIPAMIFGTHAARLFKVPRRRLKAFTKLIFIGFYIAAAFLVPIPIVAAWATGQYAQSQGYAPCGQLFQLHIASYTRGYVNDPRLCVHPSALEASLERYGYDDALRRSRVSDR